MPELSYTLLKWKMASVFQLIDILLFSLLLTALNSSIDIIYQNVCYYSFYILFISFTIYLVKYLLDDLDRGGFYLIHNFSFPLLLFSITKLNFSFETQITNLLKLFSVLISISSIIVYLFGEKITVSSFRMEYLNLLMYIVHFQLLLKTRIKKTNLRYVILLPIIYHVLMLKSISCLIDKKEYYKKFGEFNIFSQLISSSLLFSIITMVNASEGKCSEWELCIAYIIIITEILIPLFLFGVNALSSNKIFLKKNLFYFKKNLENISIILAAYFPIFYSIKLGTEILYCILRIVVVSSSVRILIIYWIFTISAIILLLTSIDIVSLSGTKRGKIIIRKAFHLLVVSLFAPPIIAYKRSEGNNSDLEYILPFTVIAIYISSSLYIILEIIRRFRIIGGLTNVLNSVFMPFIDTKDHLDGFVITHICLLIGVSFPIIVEFSNHNNPKTFDVTSAAIGIATVGIGDALSAIAGASFGNISLPGNSNKTLLGMVSFLISALASFTFICNISLSKYNFSDMFLVSFISSILEAYTLQIDNIIIPIYVLAIYFNIH